MIYCWEARSDHIRGPGVSFARESFEERTGEVRGPFERIVKREETRGRISKVFPGRHRPEEKRRVILVKKALAELKDRERSGLKFRFVPGLRATPVARKTRNK